jgi:PAS domain S-box-containing protein
MSKPKPNAEREIAHQEEPVLASPDTLATASGEISTNLEPGPMAQEGRGGLESALKEARRSEAELRRVIDTVPALAWCNLANGCNEFVNKGWCEYTGLSPEKAHGWGWKAAIHPEDLPGLMQSWETFPELDKPVECEARLRRSDGVFRWFLFRCQARPDSSGAVARWYGTASDVEDQKQTDTLRGAEVRALEMISDGASLTDILNHVCSSIDLHIAPWITSILLMDADGKRLWPSAGSGVPHDWARAITPLPVAPDTGLCGTAAFLKTRVIVPDVAAEPVWREDLRDVALENGIRAGWSQPILTKDKQVLGTFAIYSAEPHVPTGTELALVEGAGRIALIAIERQRSQEALRTALYETRKSEEELRRITDVIPQTIVVLSPDGRANYANRVALEYTGLSLNEMSADEFRDRVFHPEDIQRLREERQKALSGTVPFENEQRALGKDGKYRWFLIRYNPMLDETGKVVRWYATGTDIEDRKQAENKLREDERELRQLIDFLPQHVIVLDKQGTLLQVNKTMLDYTGYTSDEMKRGGDRERIKRDVHPDDLERTQSERKAGLSKGVPFEIEKRLRSKDGQFRWFLFRYRPVLDGDGQVVRWFVAATDFEDRKQAEDRMRNETVALREDILRSSMFEEIIGSSEALHKVLSQVSRVAPTNSTVLIQGETGTGKELIARAIHNRSKRASRAFIGVNCAAIPPSLIASELFGHEKGAFTGALQRRLGRFESADGGTIFLDEIGEMPPETQIALLRVLQEHEIERIGGNQSIPVDVRVLAATNRDLSAAVAEGTFRQDLFYRFNVFPIQLPPLRDRAADIPLLVEYLVERYAQKAGKRILSISKGALDLFQNYDWPGNIRELQNVVERAVILCEGETFSVDASWLAAVPPGSVSTTAPLVSDLARREKAMIENALREAQGRISGPTGAAAKLGLPRQTLESKIKRLGIKRHRLKIS